MIEPYSHTKHFEMVERWLARYGMRIPPKSFFSDLGLVVDKTAVGFLYLTNSTKAYVDQVAADPGASKEKRSEALDTLIEALSREARAEKVEMLQVITTEPLSSRFLRHGYETFGRYTLLIKQESLCLSSQPR